jgi:hypothetical protein
MAIVLKSLNGAMVTTISVETMMRSETAVGNLDLDLLQVLNLDLERPNMLYK